MRHQRYSILTIACSALVGLLSDTAYATIYEVDNFILVPYANSTRENGASFGVAYSTTDTHLTGATCSSLVYIAPEDKQLFATALSAQTASIHVSIKFDDAATAASVPSWGSTLNCKLLSIWTVKTSY